ncbi:MAG TPA: hypothetical protein VK530_11820 [Candidatus Acidoferrum sp.]|nr:hypothetical protein [Candidatus Acidoferrum sp.]
MLFGKLIEPTLIQPTFVTHLPKELVPLAKLSPDDSTTVESSSAASTGRRLRAVNVPPASRRVGRSVNPNAPLFVERLTCSPIPGPAGRRGHVHDAPRPGKHPRCDPLSAVEAEVTY